MRSFLVRFVALMLTACAAPLRAENGKLSPPEGKGYVIVAVTMDTLNDQNSSAGIRLDGGHKYMAYQHSV